MKNSAGKPCKPTLQGLQFLIIRTGGLLVSVTHGRGFTIQKLTSEDGTVSWAGPLYSTVDQIGLGLSVGQDLSFVSVLDIHWHKEKMSYFVVDFFPYIVIYI